MAKLNTPQEFKNNSNSFIDFETNQIIYQYAGKNYLVEAAADKDNNIINFIQIEIQFPENLDLQPQSAIFVKGDEESEEFLYNNFLEWIDSFKKELNATKEDLNKVFH